MPGHHVQVDVKFLSFSDENSNKTRRFQYTAIDDATRIRALKVYEKHNQECAIDYINHVVEKFPFRIKIIRTDYGHEFQAKFHWHCEDLGLQHVYIKPASPNLNDKVERLHLSDKQEFYQVTFRKKRYDSLEMLAKDLDHWRDYYNNERTYQGKMCCGRTPMNTLTNGKRIWAEKNLTQI